MNRSSGLFQLTGILTLIVGIITAIGYGWLVFPLIYVIPIIIAGSKFLKYANMTDEQFQKKRNSAVGWSIFLIIFCLFTGVLAIIGVCQIPAIVQAEQKNDIKQKVEQENSEGQDLTSINDEVFDKKLDKINRLEDLRHRNVISEQEFEDLKYKILKE